MIFVDLLIVQPCLIWRALRLVTIRKQRRVIGAFFVVVCWVWIIPEANRLWSNRTGSLKDRRGWAMLIRSSSMCEVKSERGVVGLCEGRGSWRGWEAAKLGCQIVILRSEVGCLILEVWSLITAEESMLALRYSICERTDESPPSRKRASCSSASTPSRIESSDLDMCPSWEVGSRSSDIALWRSSRDNLMWSTRR